MSPATAPAPLPVVPPEVEAFARESGVAFYVPAVLTMTRDLFPAAPMRVYVEDDPEIANDRHIMVEVDVSAVEDDRLFDLRYAWTGQIFDCCPATHVCVFRLAMV
jgi:hypothetical protein